MRHATRRLAMVAVVASVISCSGDKGVPTGPLPTSEATVKNATSATDGSATFSDNGTGETVRVEVVNESGQPLAGMRVQFWDRDDYELFIVEDPDATYRPTLRIYPHNSSHRITMWIDGDHVRPVASGSELYAPTSALIGEAESDWDYLGRRSAPEDWEEYAGQTLIGFVRFPDPRHLIVESVMGLLELWDVIEFPEYDEYLLYPESPITTTIRVWVPVASTNESPSAAFGYTCEDLTCSFFDQSSDADGSVARWDWDFGDGQSSTSQNPVHTYNEAGVYFVTLTVRDNEGAAASLTGEVTVSAANPATGIIAFVSDRSGNSEIYLIDADGGFESNVRNLTNDPARDRLPAVSPDGSKIAFVSDRGGSEAIYVMNIQTQAVQKLTPNGITDFSGFHSIDWHPSGGMLAFEARRNEVHVIDAINADGTGYVPNFVPTSYSGQVFDAHQPHFSADGQRLYMKRNPPFNGWEADVYVMDLASASQTRLTFLSGFDVSWPRELRVGGALRIVFGAGRPGVHTPPDHQQIFLLDPSSSAVENISNTSHEEGAATGPFGSTAANYDGRIVFQSYKSGSWAVWQRSVDGSGESQLTADGGSPDWWVP